VNVNQQRTSSAGWVCGIALGTFMVWALLGRLLSLGTAISGVLALLPFVGAAFTLVLVLRPGVISIRAPGADRLPLLAWVVLFLVAIARSNRPDHEGATGALLAAYWLLMFAAVWILSTELHRRDERIRDAALFAVCLSPAALALVNLVLWRMGVEPPQELYTDVATSRMASWFGVDMQRVLFPLARGINSYGAIAGLGIAGALATALTPGIGAVLRLVASFLATVSTIVVIMCDSRAALVFGIASALVVTIASRLGLVRHGRLTIPLMPALPAIVLSSLLLIANTPLGDALSRRPGDIESATSRVFFWTSAVAHLSQPQPLHVIGWGQYGQAGSGVSDAYGDMFTTYEADAELMSLHNSTLQLVFDVGLVGLVIVMGVLWRTWGYLSSPRARSTLKSTGPLMATLLFVLLEGATEATLSLYFPEILILVTIVISMNRIHRSPPTRARSQSAARETPELTALVPEGQL